MKYIIYKATSPSNRHYIGYTSSTLEARKAKHVYAAFNDSHLQYNYSFMRAIRKYKEKLNWSVIEYTNDLTIAHTLEKHFIELFHSYEKGYNMTKGGEGYLKYSDLDISNNAKNYTNVTDWIRGDNSFYVLAQNRGENFYKECTKHMIPRKKGNKVPISKELILNSSKTFNSIKDWDKQFHNYVVYARRYSKTIYPGLYEECTSHMKTLSRGRHV